MKKKITGPQLEHSPVRLPRAHTKGECRNRPCAIHRRSDHALRGWMQRWRTDRYLMERVCSHGIGHPDPDHIAFIRKKSGDAHARMDSLHNCDGCCKLAEQAHKDHQLITKALDAIQRMRKGPVSESVVQLCDRLNKRVRESLSSTQVSMRHPEPPDEVDYDPQPHGY